MEGLAQSLFVIAVLHKVLWQGDNIRDVVAEMCFQVIDMGAVRPKPGEK